MKIEEILENYNIEVNGTVKFVKKDDNISIEYESKDLDFESLVSMKQMLTLDEVSTLLKTSRQTTSMLREVGILGGIKTGKNYMFSIEEIGEFQRKYKGKDVSNKVKAIEAYNKVENNLYK